MCGRPHRHPSQLNTENQQQKGPHDKARHGRKQGYKEDDDMVRPLVAVQSRRAAQNNAEDQGHDNGHASDFGRYLEGTPDGIPDITSGGQGNTEIAVKNILHIDPELDPDRLIQMKSFVQHFHDSRRLGLLTVERSAGDCVHGEECDQADQKQSCDRQQNSFDNVLRHFTNFSPFKRIISFIARISHKKCINMI